jgi:hypothetical protein
MMDSYAANAIDAGSPSASCLRAVAVMTSSYIYASRAGRASAHCRSECVKIFDSAVGKIRLGISELTNECTVSENGNGFLKALQVVGGHDHRRGLTVNGHRDAFMLTVDTADHLGKVSFDLSKRHRRHGHKYDHVGADRQSLDQASLATHIYMRCTEQPHTVKQM